MNENPNVHFIGGFAYVTEAPAERPDLVRTTIRQLLVDLAIDEDRVKVAHYHHGGDQGGWQPLTWSLVEDAISTPTMGAIDLLSGSPRNVRFTLNIKLRWNPAFGAPRVPWCISFLSEATAATEARVVAAGRTLLTVVAEQDRPISGGVFRAPTFNQAHSEIGGGGDHHKEPAWFYDRWRFDSRMDRDRWRFARRLYPITLLGPALAAQVSSEALRAAGAPAVTMVNGSMIIDAPSEVVETWDPNFLTRTVDLRRLLWPLTIKNPADAAGLG